MNRACCRQYWQSVSGQSASNQVPIGRKMSKNVVFVLPDFRAGGAQKVLLTFATRLDRSVFTPIIVVLEAEGPFRSLLPSHIEVISLECSSIRAAMPVLPRILRSLKPHVIVSTMAYVNIALLLIRPFLGGNVRYLVREANAPSELSRSALGRAGYRLAYRFLYPWADHIICPAEFLAEELHADFGISRKKLTALPNPIDEDGLRTAADKPRRVGGGGRRFVSVGRLTAQKGYDRLLFDFARLAADSHLTIFGKGELRGALVRQVAELGLTGRVALAGFEPQPAPWLAGADAFLLTSRWEGLPNVALEALACGTPVIGTPEAGGIAEISARAPRNAVMVAAAGSEFIEAMRSIVPRSDVSLRSSLLPAYYGIDNASRAFAALLAA
jgi:glycosyltransferase involved in cell wall biosynthesis